MQSIVEACMALAWSERHGGDRIRPGAMAWRRGHVKYRCRGAVLESGRAGPAGRAGEVDRPRKISAQER